MLDIAGHNSIANVVICVERVFALNEDLALKRSQEHQVHRKLRVGIPDQTYVTTRVSTVILVGPLLSGAPAVSFAGHSWLPREIQLNIINPRYLSNNLQFSAQAHNKIVQAR